MDNQRLKAALYYASLGWAVFPLAPYQKIPITKHGVKDASKDVKQIEEWWNKYPTANIGLACGEISGIYAVDIDVKEKDNINGFNSLKEFPALPKTIKQNTPNKGSHYLYRCNVAPANRNNFRLGIDIRGNGYYIVLPPSTHPNGGTYKWSEGCEPWNITAAEYPDFLRPTTKAPWSVATTVSIPGVQINNIDAQNVLLRAKAYLETCDPAIQGQAGHEKLLYAASRLVHGFLLDDNQCYSLLVSEYNPRCIPPWDLSIPKDEKDFRRKISEARRLPSQNPEGWLLNEESYGFSNSGTNCNVDVASIITRPKEKKVIYFINSEYEFLIKPPGLLGDICQWINSTAIKEQPLLALACSLAFLGALFGRKVKDELGSRTNLYCMGVAPSSAGKAHAMNQTRRLATASGCASLLGGDDIASDSAIEERIHRQPATLFLWDEVGHLLSNIKKGTDHHKAQVVSLLMKLYSAAGNIYLGKEYAEQQKQRIISQPCCCIYGTSTMERFASGISPIELQDGWLSRCLVFHSTNDSKKIRGRMESTVPADLCEHIKRWFTRNTLAGVANISSFVSPSYNSQPPEQFIVPTSYEAEKIFIGFDNETIEYGKQNPLLACLWAKGEENARRIALIVACGVDYEKPSINEAIAFYSVRLIHYILMDFGNTIAPEIVTCDTDSQKRKLIKVIEKSGQLGILQCDITKSTQDMRRENRNKFLDDLCESNEIVWDRVDLKKGVTRRFWTAENYVNKLSK